MTIGKQVNISIASTIGVIGDIHCQDRFLKTALNYLSRHGVGNVYSTGDIADGVGNIHRCIEYIVQANVKVVLGNRDDWLLQNVARDLPNATLRSTLSHDEIEFIKSLPRTLEIATAKGKVLLCHGVGTNYMRQINEEDEGYALESNEDLQQIIRERKYNSLINGHSHKKMFRTIKGLAIINAGSLAESESPSFLIIDTKALKVHFLYLDMDGNIQRERKYDIK
jgi:putative phosphoesterase